jgi:FxsC-like protein
MSDYLFFLSYARRDAKGNPWLGRFYARLALEVGRACGLPSAVKENEIGFFDEKGIEAGDEWPHRLAEGLQTCKVFVCLYSKSYFKSEYCGKEFNVFRSRLAAYHRTHNGEAPGLILPVLWDLPTRIPEQLPEAVADIQYKHAELGEMYAERGLFYLIRTNKEAEYEEFIINFADRIVKKASGHDLPRLDPFPGIKSIKSAFHAIPDAPVPAPTVNVAPQRLPASADPPTINGPEVTWYVYLAGCQADYEGVRSKRECYGQMDGREWKPHLPPVEKKVSNIAQLVALEKDLTPDVLPLSQDLIANLRNAEETNTIAVLLVDPWSVKFEPYRKLMSYYDKNRFFSCGVIIVWNDNDDETMENHRDLRENIEETFRRNLGESGIFFRDSVRTEDEFRAELSALIDRVRERLMKRGKPARPTPGGGASGGDFFPTISGQ